MSKRKSPRSAALHDSFEIERHFDTDHLIEDLGSRSVRGGLVTATAQVVKFVVQTGVTMALARLLTPADFGLIAMVAFFTGFIGLFGDLGLSAATVQRRTLSHAQVSALFWVNTAAGVVLMVVACVSAPLIAWFYDESVLAWIALAISVTYVFSGISAQHLALLRRQMRITAIASVEIGALLAGAIAGLSIALLDGGYWALVTMAVAQAVTTALLASTVSGWRPGTGKVDAGVGAMLKFGGQILGSRVLNFFSRNTDNLLIGRFLGASDLGIYSRAYALLLLPVQQINRPIASVAIPALSRLQADPVTYRRYYLKMVQIIAYASMPLVVVIGVLADEIVWFILGPQWEEAVLIFRIFAVFVVFQNVVVTTGWVLQSLGKGRRMVGWSAIHAIVFIGSCLIGLRWGMVGVAVAVTTQAAVMSIPAMLVAYHGSPVAVVDVAKAIMRPVAVAGLVGLCAGAAHMAVSDFGAVWQTFSVLAMALICVFVVFVAWPQVRDDILSVAAALKK